MAAELEKNMVVLGPVTGFTGLGVLGLGIWVGFGIRIWVGISWGSESLVREFDAKFEMFKCFFFVFIDENW